ncbi:unnamed protein product, partial [marine sediment metagenome]
SWREEDKSLFIYKDEDVDKKRIVKFIDRWTKKS